MGNEHEELEELRARYAAMVEQAPEAIVIFELDRGCFVEANPAACALFGMERAALLHEGPATMSPEHQPDGRPSADAARAYIARAMAGEPVSFEWTHRSAAGADILCRVQLVRVESGGAALVRGNIVDISRERESEYARARFQAILDQTPDFVGMSDAEMCALYVNPAGRRLLGIGLDEDLTGVPIRNFHTASSIELIRDVAIPHAIEHGVWRGECELATRDGRVVPVSQVVIAHHGPGGEVDYLSTIARDMTERVAAEARERKLLHAQKLESLGVLAGGIAHDFNNILVGVLSNVSLLLRMATPGDPVHALATEIESSSLRAADLARQMLSYAGRTPAARTTLRLPELVTGMVEFVRASVTRSAELRLALADDVPPIEGDAAQLRQVLINLVGNASDALGDESGRIDVRIDRRMAAGEDFIYDYRHKAAREAEHVVLEVSDDGPGVDRAVLRRMFEPFFTTKMVGRGLGLAAVLGVARAHRAAVRVVTAPGDGTSVSLWFAPASSVAPAKAAPESARADGQGACILVVDDEAVVRRALRALLGFDGYEVIDAASGADAVEIFTARSAEISAVLLDLTMPGMSGQKTLEALRAIRSDVPIVMISGFSDSAADVVAADGFVSKPFTADEISAVLRRVIDG